MAVADHFPPPPQRAALQRETKCSAPAILRVAAALRVRTRSVPGKGIAVKAATGAAEPPAERHPMTHDDTTFPFFDTDDQEAERHTASPTAHLLGELALYGHRPGQDEPDPRLLPEPDTACRQIEAAVEAIHAMLTGTRLEDDLADLLWSFVNLFHRKIDRIEAELDRNEQAQRRSQAEQDGSEVKSVELERLIDEGKSLIERRNAFEFFRDHGAELFESATGSAWRPLAGSMVNRRALTAAMIDSREFIAARRRADAEVLAPSGPRIAFTGGPECNDHRRIWDALDKVRAKHPDMVLLHGGSPRGAERIAACWADNRQVPQVVFKPDWTRHRNAAPFKRNDRMLEALPIGVVVFPGSGIAANLADKARMLGIPVWRFADDAEKPGGGAA
jgi:SLOG family YspA-like protein